MKKMPLVIIVVIVAAIVTLLLIFARRDDSPTQTPATATPSGEGLPESSLSPQERQEAFENAIELEHVDLTDVTGADGTGLATRVLENGIFTHTVSASLPSPPAGQVYEGWLVRGTSGASNFDFISTGVMEEFDDGTWFLLFNSDTDYTDHPAVVITLETVVDATPEVHILEGEFSSS